MDFDQDYEEFCKQMNGLHVGRINFLLTVAFLFFSVLCDVANRCPSEGRGVFITEVTENNLILGLFDFRSIIESSFS